MSLPGIMWLKGTGAVAAPATINFNNTATFGSNIVSSGSLSVNTGTADPTRLVIVSIMHNGNVDISSVTIAGITATKAVSTFVVGSSGANLWYANVTTGTTATVAFSFSGTANSTGCAISSWSAYGLQSFTPVNTQSGTNSGQSSITTPSTTTQSGGVAVAAAAYDDGTGGTITAGQSGSLTSHDVVGTNYASLNSGCTTEFYYANGAHDVTSGSSVSQTFTASFAMASMATAIASWR